MQTQHLRYFVAVALSGSFSQAAKDLYMTQPPLSTAISQLEEELQTRLFIRHSRGVQLTETGREVLRYAEHMMHSEADLAQRVRALEEGREGTLRIGYSPAVSSSLMPELLRELSSNDSNINLSLHEVDPLTVIATVANGEFDVGLVTTATAEDIKRLHKPVLVVEAIGEQRMIGAFPPQETDLAPTLHLRDIADREFAVPTRTMRQGVRVELLSSFEHAGLVPPKIREVTSLRAAFPLIAAGLVVAMVPDSFKTLIHPGMATFREVVDGPRSLEISAICRSDNYETSTVERFRKIATRLAADLYS